MKMVYSLGLGWGAYLWMEQGYVKGRGILDGEHVKEAGPHGNGVL